MRTELKSFITKQVSIFMAVLMAFLTIVSAGLSFNSVKASSTTVYGDKLVEQLVDIAKNDTKYTPGGKTREDGVDSSNYPVLAIKEIFGNTIAHFQDESTFDIDDTSNYLKTFKSHLGERIYFEGNGMKMYFTVSLAAQQNELKNNGYGIADMKIGDFAFSSTLSQLAQTPGTIICYNGHSVVGMGVYQNTQEVVNKYPSLNKVSSGTDGNIIINFYEAYYIKGNAYAPTDSRYWFGKTCYIAAMSPSEGIKVSNASIIGKTPIGKESAPCVVLTPDSKPLKSTINIKKLDSNSGKGIASAVYGIYKDAECKSLVNQFTTSDSGISLELDRGIYYLKEIAAPKGYELSNLITKIDATGAKTSVVLKDDSKNTGLLVRVTDKHNDSILLENASVKVYEYNKKSSTYNHELTKLNWSKTKQAYVISGEYTNNEGTKYTDNLLHFSDTNQGRFKIVETGTQDGYDITQLDTVEKYFNILEDGATFTNENALTSTAKLSLTIKVVNGDGDTLSGAKFSFLYDGQTYVGTTNSEGLIEWGDISGANKLIFPEGADLAGILTQTEAPSGYEIQKEYKDGKKIALSKLNFASGSFFTEFEIKNYQSEVTEEDGKILIENALPNAHYGIFTDKTFKKPATDKENNKLNDVTISVDGTYETGYLVPGVYYVKETKSANGYSANTAIWTVNIMGYDSDNVYTINGNNKKQTVELELTKVDENGNPIPNAIFALSLKSKTSIKNGKTLDPQIIGYYKTDANGKIIVSEFGKPTEKLIADDETEFTGPEIKYDDESGQMSENEPLPNAKYEFVEVGTPKNFAASNQVYSFDATARTNDTNKDLTIEEKNNVITIGPLGATMRVALKTPIVNYRKGVKIELQKYDRNNNTTDVNTWYKLKDYDAQKGNGIATLEGAEYALLTNEPININNIEIPSKTVVATGKTDKDGKIKFDSYNAYGLSGPILSGKYSVIETAPSYGYAINVNVVSVDASWVDGKNDSEFTAKVNEEIVKQAIKISKIDGDTQTPISGAEFEIYPVSKIIDNGGSIDKLTRETFQKLIDDGIAIKGTDLKGNSTWTTDESGNLTTGKFIKDSYVVWEKNTNEHQMSEPILVTLPSIVANGYDKSDPVIPYLNTTIEQPSLPFEIKAINFTGKSFVQIVNVDSETGETINGAEFKIYDSNETLLIQNEKGDPWKTVNGSFITEEQLPRDVYKIKETLSPSGYVGFNEDIIFDNSSEVPVAKTNNSTLKVERNFNEKNQMITTIIVPNTQTTSVFTKYETLNDKKEHVENVVLTLNDDKHNVVYEWNTSNDDVLDKDGIKAHQIKGLPIGEYTLTEKETPSGYVKSDPMTISVKSDTNTQYFAMENKPITISIDKIDAESKNNIPNASLKITTRDGKDAVDADGNKLEWKSTKESKTFYHIPAGEYTLKEITAPNGYQRSEDIDFKVSDTDDSVQKVESMVDNRTFGQFTITKLNPETGNPIGDVVFQIRSKNEVVDPITGDKIFDKDQIIETITTDYNGLAAMNEVLPIATYDENGIKDYIEYYIVEKSSSISEDIKATSDVITINYEDDKTPVIVKSLNFSTEEPDITVKTTSSPKTYEGDYDKKENLSVVKDGDKIAYTISVTNNGMTTAQNIVVKNALPDGTVFESATDSVNKNNYELDENNNLYVKIDEIQPGVTVKINFNVKVDSKSGPEIVNTTYWTILDSSEFNPDGSYDWNQTNSVVHQVIEFNLTSNVNGGANVENATPVSYGDKIKYTITVKSLTDISDFKVTDIIPEGLTYVSQSATIDGEASENVSYNPSERLLAFEAIDITAGAHNFEFEVTVDYVDFNKEIKFDNFAEAEFLSSNYEDKHSTIESNHLFHFADTKLIITNSGSIKTYEGSKDDYKNLTALQKDDVVKYTITLVNDGSSTLKNIVIKDVVPEGTEYIDNSAKGPEGTSVYSKEGYLVWKVPEITKEANIELTFNVRVVEQKAQIIDNVAQYAVVDTLTEDENVPNEMFDTNHVMYQVVEFHKTSEVPNGKEDSNVVSTGDKIVYTLTYKTKAPTTGVIVGDKIPKGLTIDKNSIIYQRAGSEEWEKADDLVSIVKRDGDEWILFPELSLNEGTTYFRFTTTVDRISIKKNKTEYVNRAAVTYNSEPNNPDSETKVLTSNEISHITEISLAGVKTSETETFHGNYEDRKDVTVVNNGDPIVYTITIKNNGVSDVHDVFIKDEVPVNTTLIKDGKQSEERSLMWYLEEIKAGESQSVSFNVVVTAKENKALEIVNIAEYALMIDFDPSAQNEVTDSLAIRDIGKDHIVSVEKEDLQNKDNLGAILDSDWTETDATVYQLAEFHKDSSIDHGTNRDDAPYVEIGSKFSYIMTFECVDTVYGLSVSDIIPAGLKYVDGSAKIKVGTEEKEISTTIGESDKELSSDLLKLTDGTEISVKVMEAENVLIFDTIQEIQPGKVTLTFDVEVMDVNEYDKDYFFINQAKATMNINKNSEKTVELKSEAISHKTYKTNKADVPVLGFEGQNASIVWSIISIVCFVSMLFFGYMGIFYKKKKSFKK